MRSSKGQFPIMSDNGSEIQIFGDPATSVTFGIIILKCPTKFMVHCMMVAILQGYMAFGFYAYYLECWVGICILWTGVLDWSAGMEYWNGMTGME